MRRWYIVTTYAGYENSVKQDLERRIQSMDMSDKIYQVLVPEETVEVTDKNGKKKEKVNKMYSGYVFVEMEVDKEMDDTAWFNVRNTPKVTGFLGSSGGGAKPVPVLKEEMVEVFKECGIKNEDQARFEIGEEVSIIAGPFAGQTGKVESVDYEKETLRVSLDFFGRSTPADLNFLEVKQNE